MNLLRTNRMIVTIASCFLAVGAATSSAQETDIIKPLRLTDLATAQDVAPQPAPADGAQAPELPAEESAASTEGIVGTSNAAVIPSSRWSALPLPGGEKGIAAVTEVGKADGEGARDVLQVGGGLAGVLLLIWLLRTLIRKSSTNGTARSLLARVRAPEGVASILARYPVARGEHVVLLEVGRRILVVHQASGSMTTLSELTDRDEVADIRARINGEEREKATETFAPALEASLEAESKLDSLQPVQDMPGFVAETVDLTRRKRARLSGGAA